MADLLDGALVRSQKSGKEVGDVASVKLAHDVGAMKFDGTWADPEISGCLLDNLELDGLTLLEELKRTGADLPVILVADRAKAASVGAVKLLIADLLEKPFTDDFLVDSVRKVQQFLWAQSPTNLEPISVDRLSLLSLLSERERDILERIVSGMSNKSIASSLGIELRTVELCRISAMNKLGVVSLKELIRLALAAGIKLSAFTAAIGLAFR